MTPPDYCLFFINWWPLCMQKSEWASWAQAVFSVLAIAASAGYVLWNHRLERAANQAATEAQEIAPVRDICSLLAQVDRLIQHCAKKVRNNEQLFKSELDEMKLVVSCLEHFSVTEFQPVSLRPAILHSKEGASKACGAVWTLHAILLNAAAPGDTHIRLAELQEGNTQLKAAENSLRAWMQDRSLPYI